MNRAETLREIQNREKPWDIVIIGGGATGAGCALDAASRGFDVLLLEQHDFGKGTSSRSTKLVHGGVHYLANGDFSLVRESLKERGILLRNAPHLVKKLGFVVPCYSFHEKFYYAAGLKVYGLLSGGYGFGKSRVLSKKAAIEKIPNVQTENLSGGVLYFDGQFDDSRLLIDILKTAHAKNASLLNYARVFSFTKNAAHKIEAVNFQDGESGGIFSVKTRAVINATGAYCDWVRRYSTRRAADIIAPSQGIHLVFDKSFLPGETAVMIPKTSDGRILFAIPWNGKTLVGTTDTPLEKPNIEPVAFENEIEFILETIKDYLAKPPQREDIKSVFAGIRPLVKSGAGKNTAALSRDYTIEIDDANLLTITGGKWTTYRKMAEDAVNQIIKTVNLPARSCVTKNLKIENLRNDLIENLCHENPQFAEKLYEDFEYKIADVIYSVRFEMARTVEDVLARRLGILFIDARAAIEIAPKIAEIMAAEFGKDEEWANEQVSNFNVVAENYVVSLQNSGL